MDSFREIWAYRFALHNLVLKDFRVRYRNMSLGMLWSLLNPLVMLGVLVFVFSYIFPQPESRTFPIFILIGLVFHNFLSLSVSAATNSIVENASLIKKLHFPRLIIPLAVVLSQAIHIAIQTALVFLFILLFRLPVTPAIFWLAVALLVAMVFILGLCLICSALDTYYRDVLYISQSALIVLFWLSPVFYPLSMVRANLPPWFYALYLLNPLAGCIDVARAAVLDGTVAQLLPLGVAAAVAVAFLAAGGRLFLRLQRNFADHV